MKGKDIELRSSCFTKEIYHQCRQLLKKYFYKIIQIVRALWLAIKPFYMSVCKHGFRSSFISYFIKEM